MQPNFKGVLWLNSIWGMPWLLRPVAPFKSFRSLVSSGRASLGGSTWRDKKDRDP